MEEERPTWVSGTVQDDQCGTSRRSRNAPQKPKDDYFWIGGNLNDISTREDWVFHGVIMSRTGTVGVWNYNKHSDARRSAATPPAAAAASDRQAA